MLPDFVKLKQDAFNKILVPAFLKARRLDPLLSVVKSSLQHEGSESKYSTVEGSVKTQEYTKFEEGFEIKPKDVTDNTFDYFVKRFEQMGVEATSQIAQYSFKKIGEVIDEAGNTIEAKGQPFSPDLFLKAMETIQIDFDEVTNKAQFPTVYIHPSQAEHVKQMIKDAEANPEFKKRFDAIVEVKRKEWHDREANRKLVE